MKILAFMQNPWFKPGTPDTWVHRYRDDQEFHRKVLGRSMSGGRLRFAFKELYDEIHWDNINWRHAEEASGILPPDTQHVERVIEKVKPDLIICFGRLALTALTEIDPPVPVWGCHHPNARGKTQADLDQFADLVFNFKKNHESTEKTRLGN